MGVSRGTENSELYSQKFSIILSVTKIPEGRGRRGLMVWETPPESVLVIRKLDKETVIPFLDLVSWIGLKSNILF